MSKTREKSPYITVLPLAEGLFRASCPWAEGLFADGATVEEAEDLLLGLLEIRIESVGPIGRAEPIDVDPDAAPMPDEV